MERIPFSDYENKRFKTKQKRQCAFYNRLGIDPDPNPCDGRITDHHVLYKREGGKDGHENEIPMCEGHQHFIHAREDWEDPEEF